MKLSPFRTITGLFLPASAMALSLALSGCGSQEVKLQDAPPVAIPASKKEDASGDKTSLTKGAPAKGSSSGMNFNPSETPRP